MRKSIAAAVLGAGVGLTVALVLFWAGPHLSEWIQGPPRFEREPWVFYLLMICGTGFGALTGAVIGAAATVVEVLRSRGGSSG
jgi:hypothetical protein